MLHRTRALGIFKRAVEPVPLMQFLSALWMLGILAAYVKVGGIILLILVPIIEHTWIGQFIMAMLLTLIPWIQRYATSAGDTPRKLGFFLLGVWLFSVHFGTGVIFGTARLAYDINVAGSLYPVAGGLGLILLGTLSWIFVGKSDSQVWSIIGEKWKFHEVGVLIPESSVASGSSSNGRARYLKMIISWAIQHSIAFSGLAVILLIILLVKVNNGSISGSVSLLITLIFVDLIPEIVSAVQEPGLQDALVGLLYILSIVVPTVFITLLGEDFHQWTRQAHDWRAAILGCLWGGFLLIIAGFVITGIIISALPPADLIPKGQEDGVLAIVVQHELWFGVEQDSTNLMIQNSMLVLLLLAVVVSGLSLFTAMLRSILPQLFYIFNVVPAEKSYYYRIVVTIIFLISGFAFVLAQALSVVGGLINFYVVYSAAVIFPFFVSLIPAFRNRFDAKSVSRSIQWSAVILMGLLLILIMAAWVLPQESFDTLEGVWPIIMTVLGLITSAIILGQNLIQKRRGSEI